MSWLSWLALLHRFELGPRHVAPGQPDPTWMLRDAEHRRVLAEIAREQRAGAPGLRSRLQGLSCAVRSAIRLAPPAGAASPCGCPDLA